MNNDFWINVKKLIGENNTYQNWVANKCEVKPRTFENWIYRNILPNVVEGQKIAEALETTVEYLVTGKTPSDLSEDAMVIIKEVKKLNKEGKKAALGAIQGLQTLYPYEKEKKPMYATAEPVSFETKEAEPAYPQLVKTRKKPAINNAAAPKYSADSPELLDNVKFFDKEMVMIPYFGKTAAGIPLDIYTEPGEYTLFPRKALKGNLKDYFVLSIQGYSMVNDNINEGDMVVIKRAEEPVDGKIMLVRHEDRSTLKRLLHRDKQWFLLWDDGTGREKQVDSGDFQVQGLHIWTIKSGE
jgi:repressor LexA